MLLLLLLLVAIRNRTAASAVALRKWLENNEKEMKGRLKPLMSIPMMLTLAEIGCCLSSFKV